MVACGSLPCLRFSRFSCLAGRASGFVELLSGCLFLLQTPLVVSSFPPSTGFYWLSGPPVVLKGTPRTQAWYFAPNPATPPLSLPWGRKWPGGAREWHGIIIYPSASLSSPWFPHSTSHDSSVAQHCILDRVSVLNTASNHWTLSYGKDAVWFTSTKPAYIKFTDKLKQWLTDRISLLGYIWSSLLILSYSCYTRYAFTQNSSSFLK